MPLVDKGAKYCDSREPPEVKAPFIMAGWTEKALAHGDFAFEEAGGGLVLIERKALGQLLQDMAQGKLQRQCLGLAEACPYPTLLIEGHWSLTLEGYILDSRYTWEQVWNALQSLQDIGCRLQLTSDTSHTIRRVFELAEYYSKGHHPSIARHPSGDPRVTTLCQVEGFGEAKARAVLSVFPTLLQVAQATPEDLARAEKVGPVLARRLHRFWRWDSSTPVREPTALEKELWQD